MPLSIPEQIRLLHIERFNSGEAMADDFILAIENAIREGGLEILKNPNGDFIVRPLFKD
jgi:hypothetical protein